MDPTAPKDNSQNNTQSDQTGQDNPIQPGQFVVSGESAAQPQQAPTSNSPLVNSQAPQPQNNPLQSNPNPVSATGDLENDLKETVDLATGSNAGGSIHEQSVQSVPLEQPSSVSEKPISTPMTSQPDPTPFVQPQGGPTFQSEPSVGVPAGGAAPEPQRPDMESGSKMGKIIPVAVGLVVLVAIIAAVIWFFILNRKSKEPTTTLDRSQQIEGPASPSPASGRGFGEIEPSTSPQSSHDLTEGSVEPTPPPVENVPPPGLTTQ